MTTNRKKFNYIEPRLKDYPTFEKLLETKFEYGDHDLLSDDKFSIKDLAAIKGAFIISEPGYGKTRLLKELLLHSQEQNKQGIFIDLKKVDGDIENYIIQKTAGAVEINDKLSEARLKATSLLKTKQFALQNTDTIIVCLDALDEIKFDEFSKFVGRIKEFLDKYKRIHLFVSCRFHHFKREQEAFTELNFCFIEVKRFSSQQTHEYLETSGLDADAIKTLMDFFDKANADPLIQVPRYLEMVVDTIRDKGIEYTSRLTKTALFELFIYKKLEIEEKKINTQKKEIIKRVLEKLALLMEIYQNNVLSKEELMTFFDDVKSNLNISFLQQVPVEIFYNRSLLKDNIDTIEFENTEFQEYLAAKEILRLGRPEQVIFDIAVDQELKEIFPSWFNTLGFVIDLDIALLKPILHFGASGDSIVQDEEYHRLLTSVDTNRLSVKDKEDIFGNIFNYYYNVQHWIRFDIARNLAHYFQPSQHSLLKQSVELKGSTYITKSNVAVILESLLEINDFKKSERDYWKNKLAEFIKEKHSVLQRVAISALSKFKEIALIKQVSNDINIDDNTVIEALIDACRDAEPNDKFSIDCFIKWTKDDREYIYARYGLWEVKEKKAVKYLLKRFINDPAFLKQYMDHESIFSQRENDQIIENIKGVWDSEIQIKLEAIVISSFSPDLSYIAEKSRFIKYIVTLLKEKDSDYLFKFIAELKKSAELREYLFNMRFLFTLLLEKSHVEKFVNELRAMGEEGSALLTLLSLSTYKKEVYEEGRKYFKKRYAETEKRWETAAKKDKRGRDIYRDFLFKLEPQEGKVDYSVFDFYLQNEENLKSIITEQDRKRLAKLVTELIFEQFDPGEQTLKITRSEGGRKRYTTHGYIHIFGDCLRVAVLLGINVSKYRQRIINYIPFAYHKQQKAIFSLLPNLTEQETKSLLTIYTAKRDDDLQKYMPESLIAASHRYHIVEALPILSKFVDDPELLLHYRASALDAIAAIHPDEKFLLYTFRKYKSKTDVFQLAVNANKYLIEKFANDNAIKWRFDQIKKRAFSFIQPSGLHNVGSQESELQDMSFASPITNLKDPKYKDVFLFLLRGSFTIFKKGKAYHAYVQYLWRIVAAYFNNLRETKSYSHLKELERYVDKNSSREGVNWFKYELHKLRQEYLRYIGKPQSIAECVKIYNKLKEAQYLNIATSRDLVEVVKGAFNEDLRKWVESEGAYKFIQEASGKQEDLIQKTIKTQFENCLIKRGLRANEVNIRREEQLLDDKRSDFLISYGFIGPILIETKRLDRDEIVSDKERKKYKNKLLQYINGTKSDWGIFLIFRINDKYSLKAYLPKMKEAYKDCHNLEIMGLNCINPTG
jgi:hypothetical protein